jgi:cardiolipin synthase
MTRIDEAVRIFWPHIATAVTVAAMIWTAVHVILHKKDTKAATGWVGLIWFSPLLGMGLYWLFGINRIRRRARIKLSGKEIIPLPAMHGAVTQAQVREKLSDDGAGIAMLCQLTEKITRQPLMQGNRIVPLVNGDEAYAEMLGAIQEAFCSISLSTYIFDNDAWGRRFRQALRDAVARGVEVRVLIDAAGARYSFPTIVHGLHKDKVPVARFMRTARPWRFRYHNLRNHRKILVTDGTTGFTGGMNIRAGNVLGDNPASPVQDIHFRIQGPVVTELQRAFAEDWTFTTGEKLVGPLWYPGQQFHGDCIARGISDGPDEDFDKLRLVLLGALSAARSSIRIMTPYFLPDNELTANLRIAALRGVDVRILIPVNNNLRMVHWACLAGLEELLASGCRIFFTPPPFDHSKLVTIDNGWALLGSANWDPRSLILNFEFNVECYDDRFAATVNAMMDRKIAGSREVTRGGLVNIRWWKKLRNNFIRLFSPYL